MSKAFLGLAWLSIYAKYHRSWKSLTTFQEVKQEQNFQFYFFYYQKIFTIFKNQNATSPLWAALGGPAIFAILVLKFFKAMDGRL